LRWLDHIVTIHVPEWRSEIPKIHFVVGDFMESGPAFVEANPHLIVSLLYRNFDLRDPTARALELFLPRMLAGSVLAFDQANSADWPGDTGALIETIGLRRLKLAPLPITSISWAVLTGTSKGAEAFPAFRDCGARRSAGSGVAR